MNSTLATLFAAAVLAAAMPAGATQLITNGSFEQFTTTSSTGSGQLGYNSSLTGWTNVSNGYNFVFASGAADTTGAVGQYGSVKLWGPGDGSANGLPATSPDGGNFLAADGAYNVGAISQTVTGLTAGQQYTLGFWFAGAQQSGYNSATTEQWTVNFGGQSQSTAVLSDLSHGFTGWQYDTMTFTADGSSDILSFLATGTPNGVPPFSLLDGVSMTTVPEPSTTALMVMGILGIAGARVWRNRRA